MGSTFESLPHELERFKPHVLGKDPFAIESILQELDRSLAGGSQAKAGIDCALHDLCARALGVPLYNLLGGKVRELRAGAAHRRDQDAGRDGSQCRQAARPGLSLFQDQGARRRRGGRRPRQGDPRAGRRRMPISPSTPTSPTRRRTPSPPSTGWREYRLDLVEQPVSRHDLKGLELVTRSVPVVVEADEGAGTIDEIMTLVSNRIVDAVSLKIQKLGGLAQRARSGAHLRGRHRSNIGSAPMSAPGSATRTRSISPPRSRASTMPASSASSRACTTIRSAASKSWTASLTVPDGPGCGVEPVAVEARRAGTA